MIRIAVIGLGKMGLSHLAIANGLDGIEVVAMVDSSALVGSALSKVTGIRHLSDAREALRLEALDAVIIATPTASHEAIVREAIERGLHVFCEKPLTLDATISRELTQLAEERGLVTQVGYHNRFVACFGQLKRLVDAGAIGRISHVMGEAYGPVVTRPAKATWRGKAELGGGALMDYAAHPLNLLNWYFGECSGCESATLGKIFSKAVEDEVYAALRFGDVSAQLSVNWSDPSHRKMTTQISIWGDKGKLYADRQEVRAYLWDASSAPEGYVEGWNVRYTTDLTQPVEFYIRGEEYSAQLEIFRDRIAGKSKDAVNSFADAAATDQTIHMIKAAAASAPAAAPSAPANADRGGLLSRVLGRA
jgi:scyllo-inositol 2-dehydrogenase (NADP+)